MTFICGVQSVALQYWLQKGEEGRDDPIIVSWFLLKGKRASFCQNIAFGQVAIKPNLKCLEYEVKANHF